MWWKVPALLLSLAQAWSHEPHKIVARLAGDLLSRKAARFVRLHLEESVPSTNMVRAHYALVKSSTWADFVDDELPWSSELHFSHTPYRACEPFDVTRDCGFDNSGRCVVTGIANYTQRAADIGLSREDRAEAVKFLVHLVADAHSPMHVGFARDFGGNAIDVTLPDGSSSTLHEVWDRVIVASFRTPWLRLAHGLLEPTHGRNDVLQIPNLVVDGCLDFAAAIVSETSTQVTCDEAYKWDSSWIEPNTQLPEAYIAASRLVLERQLVKAAVRLAQLFEAVANQYFKAELEREARIRPASTVAQMNMFSLLEFDVDLEECVFEIADVAPAVPQAEEETEDLAEADVGTSAEEAAASTKAPMSPAERQASRNKAKATRRKLKKKLQFGIDMETLVLIKRHGRYFVTFRDLVSSDEYTPARFAVTTIRFAGLADPVPVVFDEAVIREQAVSRELIDAIFRHLSGLEPVEAAAATSGCDSVVCESGYVGVSAEAQASMAEASRTGRPRPFGRVPVGLTSVGAVNGLIMPRKTATELRTLYPDRPDVTNLEFTRDFIKENARQIIVVPIMQVVVITRMDWLMSDTRFVLNEVRTMDPQDPTGPASLSFIDARLVDEVPDSALLSQLQATCTGREGSIKQNVMLARMPHLLKSMFLFAQYISSGMPKELEHSVLLGIESINEVMRPDRPEMRSFEFVIRPLAEKSAPNKSSSQKVVSKRK